MTTTERGPIVYVVQEPRYKAPDNTLKSIDLSSALAYGTLEQLLETGRQTNVLNAAAVVRELRRKLADYADQDFILAAGDPVAIGIACAAAAKANRGRFTVLKWDRHEHRYYPVVVDLNVL